MCMMLSAFWLGLVLVLVPWQSNGQLSALNLSSSYPIPRIFTLFVSCRTVILPHGCACMNMLFVPEDLTYGVLMRT